jgi:hypothetical protein
LYCDRAILDRDGAYIQKGFWLNQLRHDVVEKKAIVTPGDRFCWDLPQLAKTLIVRNNSIVFVYY